MAGRGNLLEALRKRKLEEQRLKEEEEQRLKEEEERKQKEEALREKQRTEQLLQERAAALHETQDVYITASSGKGRGNLLEKIRSSKASSASISDSVSTASSSSGAVGRGYIGEYLKKK